MNLPRINKMKTLKLFRKEHIKSHLLFWCLFLVCNTAMALELKDRLLLPSKVFSNAEKSALLDVTVLGSRLIAVGERGVIVYSDDAGEKWQQAEVPVSVTLTSMFFSDDLNGWAVGHSGVILYSKDKGSKWELQLEGNQANEALFYIAKKDFKAAKSEYEKATEEEQEDLVYVLEDAEFAVSNAEFDKALGPTNPFLDVWFRNQNEGYAVGAYGLFFETRDGGKTWGSAADRLDNIDRYHLNAIRGIDGGALFIVGEAGTMFASYDQGSTWETLYAPYQGSFFGLQSVGQNGELLVYGLKGNVYRSEDDGQSWKKVDVPIETSLTSSIRSQTGAITLVGFSGVVITSNDGGDTFVKIKQSGFEAYNGVSALQNSELILVSDHGVHFQSY